MAPRRPAATTGPRPRSWGPVLGLLVVSCLASAGCLRDAPSPCEPLRDRAVVQAIEGHDATVRLPDGEPAVLHLSDEVSVSQGGHCTRTGPSGVLVGDTLTFEVDAWAESYPVQGWPEKAVVLR